MSRPGSADVEGVSFDVQAWSFDRRARLPAAAARRVARALVELAGLAAGDLLIEIGAGTGEIGIDLAAGERLRYVGVDLSLPMLTRFRAKLRGRRCHLVRADANRPWPLRSGRARQRFLNYPGKFVIHCHVLAHEDAGMMWNVDVRDHEGNGTGPGQRLGKCSCKTCRRA